jgi:spore maturation protein CgeB
MRLAILGLSLSSSWGNGHATTWRALVKALAAQGDEVLFLERDVSWYAAHRDLTRSPDCALRFYDSLDGLEAHAETLGAADAVVLGSYVPEGVAVAERLLALGRPLAFYDIDTPVTLGKLGRGDHEYLTPELVPRFDLYLSFSGGRALDALRRRWGARRAIPLYCGVDPEAYRPVEAETRWDLGYLGTYSADRQPALERLLIEPARMLPHRRFVVAGPQYPESVDWPANVERIDHVPPPEHAAFYASARFQLNCTRGEMVALGHSPSVRLFEAAACGAALISDRWTGISDFFRPGREILLAEDAPGVAAVLEDEADAAGLGAAARRRVLAEHTAAHRAATLRKALDEARGRAAAA